MVGQRLNTSRSLELLVIAANLNLKPSELEVNGLINAFKTHPMGGTHTTHLGTSVHWGNIHRLVQDLMPLGQEGLASTLSHIALPRSHPPRFLVHLDSFRKATALPVSDLVIPTVARVKGKADILIVEADGIRELSVKDSSGGENKLGQQSKRESYNFSGAAHTLSGGFNFASLQDRLQIIKGSVNLNIRPASLSEDQWGRLKNEQYRILAIAKDSDPVGWDNFVIAALEEAGKELDAFLGTAFPIVPHAHGRHLATILAHRLIDGETDGHDEWIVSQQGAFRLDAAIAYLAQMTNVKVDWERRNSPRGKPSWFVYASISGGKYLITKIEPSFDGARRGVSQTKGIIYYFQEGARHRAPSEGSVWTLLSDLNAQK
jgi:hypothetical protein